MAGKLDLTGMVFGRLTILGKVESNSQGKSLWHCKCSCGKLANVRIDRLTSGRTKSCGCLRLEMLDEKRKHGQAIDGKRSREYETWASMKNRCLNPNHPKFRLYGKRGITVCERWLNFENFFADMGIKPTGLTLERVDNNKSYYPENCMWASWRQQRKNQRRPHDVEPR